MSMNQAKTKAKLWMMGKPLAIATLFALSACSKGCGCEEQTPKGPPTAQSDKTQAPAKPSPPTPPPAVESQPPTADDGKQEAPALALLTLDALPDPVMTVSGHAVTKADLMAALALRNPKYKDLAPENLSRLIRSVMDQMAADKVLMVELEKDKIEIDQEKVSQKVAESMKSMTDGGPMGGGMIGVDAENMRQVLESGTRTNQMVEKLYESRVLRNVTVSHAEIEEYYNRNIKQFQMPKKFYIYLIALVYSETSKESVKQEALKALQRVRSGEKFSDVAREVSTDPGSKSMGGLMDRLAIPDNPEKTGDPIYDWAYFSKPGDVSEVMDYPTSNGWIILSNGGEIPGKTIPLSEVEHQIELLIKGEKAGETLDEFGQKLWDSTPIERKYE